MTDLKQNLDLVNKNIELACNKINRNSKDITLIAVTKTISLDKMTQICDLSVNNFGENKVQELMDKYDHFTNKVNWHLIGHLQTNKVKYIIKKVKLIQSVDSINLVKEINKRANENDLIMDILIEINIASEATKYGIANDEVFNFIDQVKNYRNINIKGLMTVAPFVLNPEDNRMHFRKMKMLFDSLKQVSGISMDYLSMGMTNDYMVAVSEGANMVRIGTGLFGERD